MTIFPSAPLQHRDLLPSTCRIVDARSGKGTLDRATGAVTFDAGSVRYEGPCSLQDSHGSLDGRDGGEVDRFDLRLPPGVKGLGVGMIVQVDGEPRREFTITRLASRSLQHTTKVEVERRTGRPTTAGA